MITLPSTPAPRAMRPQLIDFGIFQRPSTGAAVSRFDRPGNRFAAEFEFPPMPAATAEVFVARLLRAKSEGLRIAVPLLRSQGAPGAAAVVNGSGAGGTSLPVRSIAAGWQAKEGYWLTVQDSAGMRYLHKIAADATPTAGAATLTITPPLRAPLVDGNPVLLSAPTIEGIVTSVAEWPIEVSGIVRISFSLEEAA